MERPTPPAVFTRFCTFELSFISIGAARIFKTLPFLRRSDNFARFQITNRIGTESIFDRKMDTRFTSQHAHFLHYL